MLTNGHADTHASLDRAGATAASARSYAPFDPDRYDMESLARYLREGYWGGADAARKFDVADGQPLTYDISRLSSGVGDFARLAFDAWERVSPLAFRAAGDGEAADIDLRLDAEIAHAYTQTRYIDSGSGPMTLTASSVFLGADRFANGGEGEESRNFTTLLHEIGHALGLGHAGNYNWNLDERDVSFHFDSYGVSVMSYRNQEDAPHVDASNADPVTPMLADILAIQESYGSADRARAGDTRYGPGGAMAETIDAFAVDSDIAYTIFDTGGEDTIDASGRAVDQRIDLRAGESSDLDGLVGNVVIGYESVIENARGGGGNDALLGNARANLLQGGAGDDEIAGGDGADTLEGGRGGDGVKGGTGDDTLRGGDGADTLEGGDGADTARGGAGADTLLGGHGDDRLDGGRGRDELVGGWGDDRLEGGAGEDVLYGDGADAAPRQPGASGADRILGDAGNDRIFAGDGVDRINGGAGDDIIEAGVSRWDLRDTVYGGTGDDLIDAGHGNDNVFGMAGDDTLRGGFGADELKGQGGDDVLNGAAFSDLVFGNAGDDFVNGGFGNDRINGGTGADRFYHADDSGHGSDWIQDFSAAEGDTLVFADAHATRDDFRVNTPETPGAGRAGVDEAFVTYVPSAQILWALVDGGAETSIVLQRGDGESFDLIA